MLEQAQYGFHGGIHPPENKTQSLQLPLGRPPLAQQLILPLGQHIGQASQPIVQVGDKVLKGQAIAANNGFVSSYLHAPTSGVIVDICEHAVPHPSGLAEKCIILAPDQQDTWGEKTPLANWQNQSPTDITQHLSSMGIVGMGGAGFPTQVKLAGSEKHKITELIINAAECEPYITADDMLMREKSHALIQGILVLQHVVNAERTLIGIEDNKPTAIEQLQNSIKQLDANIQLIVVPTKYPSGGEKQLIQLLTGKEVPSGKLPADIGVICQNVGTCVAVHDAIYLGQPLISRITTLTGDAIGAAQNVEVPLGTPISHLLQYADIETSKLERLVIGGPMMGFTITDALVPVVKTTNCVLAATSKELPTPAPEQACIRCGMCEQACPANLLPQQLLWFSKSQEHEKAEHYNLFDCIECGACSYVCPSSIPLVQYYRHSKSSIREAREAAIKAEHAKLRFEARKARIEAEAAEKEAKRQANRAKTQASGTQSSTVKAAPSSAQVNTTDAQAELKKYKVELALANTKLKKAQKNLQAAEESGDTQTVATLQGQITELEQTVKRVQTQLDAANKNTDARNAIPANAAQKATPAVSDEVKKAKVALAIATTGLKKTQKQLAETPDDTELQAKEKSQLQAVEAAEKALQQANAAQTTASPSETQDSPAPNKPAISDELKKAKVAMAIATTHLKKAQEKLDADPQNSELKARVESRQQKLAEAKAALAQMQNQPVTETTAPNDGPSSSQNTPINNDALKQAKIDLAVAKAANKKVEKAIQKAQELALPELEALQTQHQTGIERIQQLETALTDISAGKNQPATTKKVQVDNPNKQLKIDHALAKAALNKVKRTIENRQKEGATDAELNAEGLLTQLADNENKLSLVEKQIADAQAQLEANTESNAQ